MKTYIMDDDALRQNRIDNSIISVFMILVTIFLISVFDKHSKSTFYIVELWLILDIRMIAVINRSGKYHFELFGSKLSLYYKHKLKKEFDLVNDKFTIKDIRGRRQLYLFKKDKEFLYNQYILGDKIFNEMLDDISTLSKNRGN